MANINLSWSVPTNTDDIDSYEVYVCNLTAHIADEADAQARLDAIHAAADADKAATITAQGLAVVETGLAKTATAITTPYSTETGPVTGAGTYHFVVAAKNQGGYKVGNGDGSAVASQIVN